MDDAYPRTILELEDRFATEAACREYLMRLRWPEGFVCPRCGYQGGWSATRGRVVCRGCRYQASVTAGTIFQDTHKPLRLWFRAIWQVTSQKNGASAANVQQVLGLGSYWTAWTWLHKLRRAMVRPGRERLHGRVEVDETYVGGESEGKDGRGTDKALVIIAVEENGTGSGRIRLAQIDKKTRRAFHGFIQTSIQPGSTIHTDGNQSYDGLEVMGYQHEATKLNGLAKDAPTELLPRVHRVASLLKRWLLGTHQGAVHPHYLDYYLDEFTFRFNRRTSRSRGKLFYRLLQQAMQVEPVPYHTIVTAAAQNAWPGHQGEAVESTG
jgi:transposase-like protein